MSYSIIGQILASKGLQPSERGVLLALAWHANDDGDNAYPSVDRVAEMASVSKRTAQRALRSLVKHLIITETASDQHGRRCYRLEIGTPAWGDKLTPLIPKRGDRVTLPHVTVSQRGVTVSSGGCHCDLRLYNDARVEQSLEQSSNRPSQKKGLSDPTQLENPDREDRPLIPLPNPSRIDPCPPVPVRFESPPSPPPLAEAERVSATPAPPTPVNLPPAESLSAPNQPAVSDSAIPETPGFIAYMEAHPKSTYRNEAWQEWQAQGLEDLTEVVVRATRRATNLPQWQQEEGRYAPNPAAFLRDGGWRALVPELKPCVHKWTDYGDLEMCGRCCTKRPSRSVEEAVIYAEI